MKSLSSAAGIKSDANYPTGYAIDPSVTKVSTTINQDIIMFFQKLIALAGITPNGNYDNESNGYQTLSALKAYYSKEINAVPDGGNGIENTDTILSDLEVIDTHVFNSNTLATITAPATCNIRTLFNANSILNFGTEEEGSTYTSCDVAIQISSNGTDWTTAIAGNVVQLTQSGKRSQIISPISYYANISAGQTLYIRTRYEIPTTFHSEYQYVKIDGILHSHINTIKSIV